jgi:hypothetical protein
MISGDGEGHASNDEEADTEPLQLLHLVRQS